MQRRQTRTTTFAPAASSASTTAMFSETTSPRGWYRQPLDHAASWRGGWPRFPPPFTCPHEVSLLSGDDAEPSARMVPPAARPRRVLERRLAPLPTAFHLPSTSVSSPRHGEPSRGDWRAAFVAALAAEIDALIGPRRCAGLRGPRAGPPPPALGLARGELRGRYRPFATEGTPRRPPPEDLQRCWGR